MVIARYISKEILSTFGIILLVLLFVALSNEFVSYLAKAASGKLPVNLVFTIVGLYIPELCCILAPVTMFIAILFSYSRMHADSEAAALFTCGYDWARLVRVTLSVAGIIAVAVAILNFTIVPKVTAYREELLADGQISGVISAITPGRFQTIEGNENLVFYVEDILSDGTLSNIFIAQQPNFNNPANNEESIVVLTAKTANVKQENPNEFYLVLHQGHRYVGKPGTANYTVTSFSEYGRQLKYSSGPVANIEKTRNSKDVFYSSRPGDVAEFQWRCAMPIALLILAMIAIPLSKVQPRQGRFAKFLPAIVVYMVYYNLLTVVKRWVSTGNLPGFPGLWAVHILFLLVGLILLYRTSGRWAEFKYEYFRSIHR